MNMSRDKIFIAGLILLFAVAGVFFYLYLELIKESANRYSEIGELNHKLADKIRSNQELTAKVTHDELLLNDLEEQVGQITGSVAIIEKLNNTDPELLQKYSIVSFLNENYVPKNLKAIDPKYVAPTSDDEYLESNVMPFLINMLDSAESDGTDMQVVSAYRSFDEQSSLKSSYKVIYGSGANKFSADQGYSEHQLGSTVDLTEEGKIAFNKFEDTEAYQWLTDNAYKYGFILSYPQANQYYVFEPWHWRFVGQELARKLNRDNLHFYDLSQREIDEYLVNLFD